jgi:hypothetical protein
VQYEAVPRVTTTPLVTLTAHPLVGLYSAPPCSSGQLLVAFRPRGTARWDTTSSLPCQGLTINTYIAGLRPSTVYDVQQVLVDGSVRTVGPMLSLTTGSANPAVPRHAVVVPPPTGVASLVDDLIFHSLAHVQEGNAIWAYATDLSGRVVWYRDVLPQASPLRPLPGGTILFQSGDDAVRGQLLQEIDLTGNILRETNVPRLNEQIAARGGQEILAIHHDALRTSNGLTLVMGFTERMFTDVQGSSGDVDVIGDSILALDADFQLVWYWDAFQHLDINRAATLGDTCRVTHPLCPPLELAPIANDWLHANSMDVTPDGHLVVSVRNQDWIIKIDFANGAGSGEVLWRLGKDGDFSVDSTDPYPWFSHQHSVVHDGGNEILIFDNGNTRCQNAGAECHSRGQLYVLDETQLTATLPINSDLGSYSNAWGAAQRLSNGNLSFTSGKQPDGSSYYYADTIEVAPNGAPVYDLRALAPVYRTFRMKSLYGG